MDTDEGRTVGVLLVKDKSRKLSPVASRQGEKARSEY